MLTVYDTAGRKVQTLVNKFLPPGVHDVVWDGRDFRGRKAAAGTYLIHLQQGEFATSGRVALVR